MIGARRALLLLVGAALAAVAAACSEGRSTGTPTPTPIGLTSCQVLWSGSASDPAEVNLFLIDAPLADWNAGAHPLSATTSLSAGATFFYDARIGSNGNLISFAASSHASGGSYTVTGAIPSGPFTVAGSASGPGFHASGSFSKTVAAAGSGTMSVDYLGSALTLASGDSLCYSGN